MSKFKLFCFPYAGGSAMVYNNWTKYLDPQIQIVPIEIAGRGRRIHENLYQNMSSAVDDLFNIVLNQLGSSPYSFFGHSMGSMICYKLAQRLSVVKGIRQPSHIFFSGNGAPHIDRPDQRKFHLMSENEFKKEILKLGGTPPQFFEHPELADLFLPILRNDFMMVESTIAQKEIQPLHINISVLFGKEDNLMPEQMEGWQKHTNKSCRAYYFEGGHFFLHTEAERIVSLINSILIGSVVAI